MRSDVILAAIGLAVGGCYGVARPADGGLPDAAASDAPRRSRRVCTTQAECEPDEECEQFLVGDRERLCAVPCSSAPSTDELCPDGLFCGHGACFPGRLTAPAGGCASPLDCPAGMACRIRGPGTRGSCTADLCDDHADCPPDSACIGRTCSPVCHPDDEACPEGFVCFEGQCRIAEQVRECWPYGLMSAPCDEGLVCWGNTADYECLSAEQVPERTRCAASQAWLDTFRFEHLYSGCFERRPHD